MRNLFKLDRAFEHSEKCDRRRTRAAGNFCECSLVGRMQKHLDLARVQRLPEWLGAEVEITDTGYILRKGTAYARVILRSA